MKTFKKIVVATDFSENSKSAYDYARHLATRFGASLHIVNFFEIPINPANPNYLDVMPTFEEVEKSANLRLSNFVIDNEHSNSDTLVAARLKITSEAKAGFAAEGLITISKDPSVDLIVMGTRGEHGLIDKVFGSIAIKVCQEAFCPVLLVPDSIQYKGVHNIIFTSSFDSAQPKEIKMALDFAKYFAASLHFVHVISKPDSLGISEQFLFRHLLREEHTRVPYTIENIHAKTSSEGINQYIDANGGDLIISVTHHRSLWQKITHHSTTQAIAWHLHTPLLVMHHDEKTQPPV